MRTNDPPPVTLPTAEQSARVERPEVGTAEDRLAFLAEASRVLGSSLDFSTTLTNIVRLAVPAVADWAAVYLFTDTDQLELVAVVHLDPAKVELAYELHRRFPSNSPEAHGVWSVFRRGTSELCTDISDELLCDRIENAELRKVLRGLGLRSAMRMPLVANGQTLGVLTLASAESERHYGPADLSLAEDLAQRCALALDNARRYQATRDAEQRFRELVDGLDAVVWEAESAGLRFTFVSHYVEKLLGYPATRWLEEPGFWLSKVHPEDRAAAVAACRKAEEGHDQDVEYRAETADGEVLWLRNLIYAVRDGGRVSRLRGVMVDATERKQAEQALRRHAQELSEAAEHKDEFLAVLAHELRNPLAPIRNALHVLELRGGQQPAREWAQDVLERQVGHLTRMVNDLLDVSRITRGKVVLKRERIDLVRLVRAAVEDQRAALERGGLAVELSLPPQSLWVLGDATRLAQVVDNLLSNAGKFTRPGGRVLIEVGGDGRQVRVTVRDTGMGIAPELLPRIFQTMTQADRTLDRTGGGLGLGLALVKGLVEMHDGRVKASSAGLDRGAEFTFWLPLVRSLADAVGGPDRMPAAKKPLRILMVEDNRDGAETLRALLQLAGHEVALACSGPAGVELARQFRPDVVLCDIGLPGMDGYAVGRALRRDPLTSGARLIVLSGYGQEEDRRKSREAGFDLHLTKPVDPMELQQLLRTPAAV
jgi:PAS domain S-box-containing protein